MQMIQPCCAWAAIILAFVGGILIGSMLSEWFGNGRR